jgi:ribonuclease HII
MQHVVCGIDEAGRGAFAGPLVAAAVILSCPLLRISRFAKIEIKDSKLMKKKDREKIVLLLPRFKVQTFVEDINIKLINKNGIGWANKEAIRRLIRKIEADEYIIDGNMSFGELGNKTQKVRSIIDADATVSEVILAGIVAKVHRDRIMKKLHTRFSLYGWDTNMGYGTKKHREMIIRVGVCKHHRIAYVRTSMGKKVLPP